MNNVIIRNAFIYICLIIFINISILWYNYHHLRHAFSSTFVNNYNSTDPNNRKLYGVNVYNVGETQFNMTQLNLRYRTRIIDTTKYVYSQENLRMWFRQVLGIDLYSYKISNLLEYKDNIQYLFVLLYFDTFVHNIPHNVVDDFISSLAFESIIYGKFAVLLVVRDNKLEHIVTRINQHFMRNIL
jgi:hypothetical protein